MGGAQFLAVGLRSAERGDREPRFAHAEQPIDIRDVLDRKACAIRTRCADKVAAHGCPRARAAASQIRTADRVALSKTGHRMSRPRRRVTKGLERISGEMGSPLCGRSTCSLKR